MDNCQLSFESIGDERGYLVSLEAKQNIPFDIKRVYYIYGTNDNPRGFHAHKKLQQVLICVNGFCKIMLDDGVTKNEYCLDSPNKGLFINNFVWREMYGFSKDCVIMVLANEYYNEDDYIRCYEDFIRIKNEKKTS